MNQPNELIDQAKGDENPVSNEGSKGIIKKSTQIEKDAKSNQVFSEKVPQMEKGLLEIIDFQDIKKEILNALNKNLNPNSPFYDDLYKMAQSLQEKGDLSDNNFICPWYIAKVFAEMLNELAIFSKFTLRKDDLNDVCTDFKKVFRVVLYLLQNEQLSLSFKAKILKQLSYDITIVSEKFDDNKTTIIEYLLAKEKFEDLDLLLREAKTLENCKAHAIEEMENTIIVEIAHQIIIQKTKNLFKVTVNKDKIAEDKNPSRLKLPPLFQVGDKNKEEEKDKENEKEKENEAKENNNLLGNSPFNKENEGALLNPKQPDFIHSALLSAEKQGKKKGGIMNTFKELKQDIIDYCVEKKMNEITKILFRKFPNEALSIKTINLALQNRCYDYLKEGSSMVRITKILIENSIMEKIISFLMDPHTFLDAVFFLYSIKDFSLPQETQKLLHETIKEVITNNDINRIFLYSMNPLLIFVMMCQIFDHLSKKCFHYQHSFKKFSLFFKGVASQIVEKYDHFYNLKKLTYQVFYPAKIPLIRMVFEDKDLFDTLFQDDRLAKITRLQLNSFYVFDFDIVACSTSFKYAIFKRALIVNAKYEAEQNTQPTPRSKIQNKNEVRVDIMFETMMKKSIKQSVNTEKEYIAGFQIFNYVSKLQKNEVNNDKNHCYQYKIYFKSIAYRTLFDAITFFSLFIYLHVNTNQYSGIRTSIAQIDGNYTQFMNHKKDFKLENHSIWRDQNTDDFQDENSTTVHCTRELTYLTSSYNDSVIQFNQTLVDYFLSSCVTFHQTEINLGTTANNLIFLCYIIIITCCNVFVRKFYQIYVRKTFNLQLIDELDLFGLADVIVLVVLNFTYSQKVFFSPDDMLFEINIKSIFIALLLFMFWLQMFQYIKLTQIFGYIVKTVELLIKETYEFLWIFFLFIAAFASINYVLFGSFYNQFSGFFLGVRNLFGYALGGFVFLDNASDYYVVMSGIINIIYVLYTNVILINLLIALLSSIYQKVSDNSDLEYSSIIYELREEKYFDKIYGSITIYPRVINTFLLPIHIMTVLFANAKLNKMIGSFGYFISLALYIAAFIALHCIIIPVAWTNILVLILLNRYHDHLISKQVTAMSKFTHILVWFFFGIPYLLYILFFNDISLLLQNAFYSSKNKKSDTSQISLVEYESLKRAIKDHKHYRENDEINTEEFIKNYIQVAVSMEKSNNLIFQKSKELLNSRTSMLLKDIRKQETGAGAEDFEKKLNVMEFKLKKMIDVIRTLSIKDSISVNLLHNILHSLKLQIKHSPGKNKIKEINKLDVVDYKDILDIFLANLKDFQENK